MHNLSINFTSWFFLGIFGIFLKPKYLILALIIYLVNFFNIFNILILILKEIICFGELCFVLSTYAKILVINDVVFIIALLLSLLLKIEFYNRFIVIIMRVYVLIFMYFVEFKMQIIRMFLRSIMPKIYHCLILFIQS